MHLFIISSPAEVVIAKSILVLVGFEGINAFHQDEVRVPVEASVAIICLTHIATI